jgi:hypothetical protein
MSSLLIFGIAASLLCLSGVIFAVLNVHRLIDLSRVHPRLRREKSIDDDGLLTRLTKEQRQTVVEENDRLAHSSIKEARLRTDLPPPATREFPDIGDVEASAIEREWIEEIRSGQDWQSERSADVRANRFPNASI